MMTLLDGRGIGRIKSCGVEEIAVECKLFSAIATAALLAGTGRVRWARQRGQ